jgi:hypothetical protein
MRVGGPQGHCSRSDLRRVVQATPWKLAPAGRLSVDVQKVYAMRRLGCHAASLRLRTPFPMHAPTGSRILKNVCARGYAQMLESGAGDSS